jgi:hypothetical protein
MECSADLEKMITCRILTGKSQGKRPLGNPRHMWKYNINVCLKDMEWDCMGWIISGQGSFQSSCEHGNEPSVYIKYWKVVR